MLHAQDLGPQNRLVQAELAIELCDGVRHGVHVDDGVDALGPLVDLVGEAPAAPHVNLVHAPAARGDHGQELLQGRLDGVFLETRVEDDHHFVMAHERNCPLWTDGHGLSVTGGTASTRARRRAGRDADAQAYQAAAVLRAAHRRAGWQSSGPPPRPGARRYDAFCHTEIWLLLSPVNGACCQSLQRSRKVIPASRAIRLDRRRVEQLRPFGLVSPRYPRVEIVLRHTLTVPPAGWRPP